MSPFIDQIHDYVSNRLPENERLAFEEACKNQPGLQKMVDHYSALKSIGLAVIDEEVRSIALEEKQNGAKTNKKFLLLFLGFILLLMVSGVYYWVQKQNQKPSEYAALYIDTSWPISRSDDGDTLSDAIRIGLEGNVKVAKNMIFATSLSTFEKNLWVAELFAKNEMADSTITYLPQANGTKLQRDRILYLQIISLHTLGKNEEVKKVLDNLPEDTDPVYLKIYDQLK